MNNINNIYLSSINIYKYHAYIKYPKYINNNHEVYNFKSNTNNQLEKCTIIIKVKKASISTKPDNICTKTRKHDVKSHKYLNINHKLN